MRHCFAGFLAAVLSLPAFAPVAAGLTGFAPLPLLGTPGCDLSDYQSVTQSFAPPFAIPDYNPAGVTVGTLPTLADGRHFTDVILEVSLAHTWVGDLVLRLEYADCESGAPLHGTNVICRPRGTELLAPPPCGAGFGSGCGGNLGSLATSIPPPEPRPYYFNDAAEFPIADGICHPLASPACYQPSPSGALSGFNGFSQGGCWTLSVADWAAGNTGVIAHWTVWQKSTPVVPARAASWGRLKTIYR